MEQPYHKSIFGPISYSPRKDLLLFIYLILIVLATVAFFKYWVALSFNAIMFGYFIFREMRWATVIFAVIIRAILYPLGRLRKRFEKKVDVAQDDLDTNVKSVKHPLLKDKAKRSWLAKYRSVLVFEWFCFCFYTMNALSVGYIFLKPFTEERVKSELFTQYLLPKFPLNTTGWIPLVGMVDLTEVNMPLNLISAIGAGLVGLVEVILHKKTTRKQLFMYLIMFPLGAYFITMWVPAGFEFTLVVFEALTILIVFAEKIAEFGKGVTKKVSPNAEAAQT
ncbi:MAG: hypothetical protein ACOX6V_02445 [Patescibacteria group bacterium]|jgi:hypothetical protein